MPLKLLKHKSWHVGTRENIERVRRDEAAEQARVEAAEERMQAEDAQNRLAILRGQRPPDVVELAREDSNATAPVAASLDTKERVPRKTRKRDDMASLDAHLKGRPPQASPLDSPLDAARLAQSIAPQQKNSSAPASDFASAGVQPWYAKQSRDNHDNWDGVEAKEAKRARLDLARKQNDDPLLAMQSFLAKKKEVDQRQKQDEIQHLPSPATAISTGLDKRAARSSESRGRHSHRHRSEPKEPRRHRHHSSRSHRTRSRSPKR